MHKVLISLPDQLIARMRATIPARQRSKLFAQLIQAEVEKREQALYECAIAVEKNNVLREEMQEWNVTLDDGFIESNKEIVKNKKSSQKKNNKEEKK